MYSNKSIPAVLLLGAFIGACADPAFDPATDLLSLHYDHAPDMDDGHSAAADRTVLETLYGIEWIQAHVVAVSGAYGLNRATFNESSDRVMDAVFGDTGWTAAHTDWESAVGFLTERWQQILQNGGDIWVKEGGQSDITAEVVRALLDLDPALDVPHRIHIVQHSTWNENQTTPEALLFVQTAAHYLRIPDANRYLNREGGDTAFVSAATTHQRFGSMWQAAFDYYDPDERLDFSDTGELLYLLGLGELGIDAFRARFF